MRFAVDLLWVRPKKVGGTEFYIRNLLEGFRQLKDNFEIMLILARDNATTFEEYLADGRFKQIVCDVDSSNVGKRIIWQNMHLSRLLKREGIKVCFEPVYSKPIISAKEIKFITTIHDLQALHYPEYQSKFKVQWLKFSWKQTLRSAYEIIATSNFVKEDIVERYKASIDNILTINIPIDVNPTDVVEFEEIKNKFQVEPNNYYYTMSSMEPHKNMETLFKVMGEVKKRGIDLPSKWLLSGINAKAKEEVLLMANENDIRGNIIITGYLENNVRNTLSKYSRAFLFPSIFEGFGMPPVEAMAFGATVITTKKASLYEVTQGKANYIKNPYDVEEWVNALVNLKPSIEHIDMSLYEPKYIAEQYIKCFNAAYES